MNKKIKAAEKRKGQAAFKNPPKYDTNRLVTYVVIFYFAIFFGLIQIFQTLDLTVYHFFRLLVIMVGICFFIPIKLYRKRWRLSYYEYTIFNIIFSGPLLLLLIFILNIAFSSASYTESYQIIDKEGTASNKNIILKLEDNKYDDKAYLRKVGEFDDIGDVSRAKKLNIEFSDGLFGIRLIKKRKLE